jgi:hypothetical protein
LPALLLFLLLNFLMLTCSIFCRTAAKNVGFLDGARAKV